MVAERSSGEESEAELLRHAVALLQSRHERGSAYGDLSVSAVADLSNVLEAVATAEDDLGKGDREEAIALAHRLVDDDHPEDSPIWPSATR